MDDADKVRFAGWARMALPLSGFRVTEVKKPNVGENRPAGVMADAIVETKSLKGAVKGEWDQVRVCVVCKGEGGYWVP